MNGSNDFNNAKEDNLNVAAAQVAQYQMLHEQMQQMRREQQEQEEKRTKEIQIAKNAEAQRIQQLEHETEELKKQLALQAQRAESERNKQMVLIQQQEEDQRRQHEKILQQQLVQKQLQQQIEAVVSPPPHHQIMATPTPVAAAAADPTHDDVVQPTQSNLNRSNVHRPTPSYRTSPTSLSSAGSATTTIPHLRSVMGLDRDPRRYSRSPAAPLLTNGSNGHTSHSGGRGSRGGYGADPRTSQSGSAFSTPYVSNAHEMDVSYYNNNAASLPSSSFSSSSSSSSSFHRPRTSSSKRRRHQQVTSYQSLASENYNHTNRYDERPSSTKRGRYSTGGMNGSHGRNGGRRSSKKSHRSSHSKTPVRSTALTTTPVGSNGVGQRILDILGEMSAPMDHARREWNISPVPFTSTKSSSSSSSSSQYVNTATKRALESDVISEFNSNTPYRSDDNGNNNNYGVDIDTSNFNPKPPASDSKLMPPPAPRQVAADDESASSLFIYGTPQQTGEGGSNNTSATFSSNSLYSKTAHKTIQGSNEKARLPSLFGPGSGSKVDASALFSWKSPDGNNDAGTNNDNENQFSSGSAKYVFICFNGAFFVCCTCCSVCCSDCCSDCCLILFFRFFTHITNQQTTRIIVVLVKILFVFNARTIVQPQSR